MGTSRLRRQEGNSTLFTISFVLACIIILLALFDLSKIYIAREKVKTVSDSIALAASQELLYFRSENIKDLAEVMASDNGCRLNSLQIGYDAVEVGIERDVHFAILGKIGFGSIKTVCSSSGVKVTYPWNRKLGKCQYYEFGYKPY